MHTIITYTHALKTNTLVNSLTFLIQTLYAVLMLHMLLLYENYHSNVFLTCMYYLIVPYNLVIFTVSQHYSVYNIIVKLSLSFPVSTVQSQLSKSRGERKGLTNYVDIIMSIIGA